MTSMRGAVVAGFALGVGGEFARALLPSTVPAANLLLVLVVLLVVVLVRDSNAVEALRRMNVREAAS
jgi:branched-subunit amino acid ABC-type transport system permease component